MHRLIMIIDARGAEVLGVREELVVEEPAEPAGVVVGGGAPGPRLQGRANGLLVALCERFRAGQRSAVEQAHHVRQIRLRRFVDIVQHGARDAEIRIRVVDLLLRDLQSSGAIRDSWVILFGDQFDVEGNAG